MLTQDLLQDESQEAEAANSDSEPRLLKLERQMSSLISSPGPGEAVNEEEAMRKRDEDQIQEECVFRVSIRPPIPFLVSCYVSQDPFTSSASARTE